MLRNEHRMRIGLELDEINAWWNKPEVSSYFDAFVSIGSEGDVDFQKKKHPINRFLMLYAEQENRKSLSLEFIEDKSKNSTLDLYKDLRKLHHTFKDWYQDIAIYHYLGYLFFQKDIKFKKVWQFWRESDSKDHFKRLLIGWIKKGVFGEDDFEIITKEKNWYETQAQRNRLVKFLLLLDVISSLDENHAILPVKAFTKNANDIEHIFPQNPKDEDDKKSYIQILNKNIESEDSQFDLSEFDLKKDDEEYKRFIDEFIQNQRKSIEFNSIGNLVLLDASINRSISNNSYAVKRTRIVEFYNEGNFIQPHTFKVYVRYFLKEGVGMKDSEYWTNIDIQKNAIAIQNTLEGFCKRGIDIDEDK